jgi:CP family cyanate transporter-like MFS transporter
VGRSGVLLAIAMVLVAANLRPAAASVGPVVDQIRDALGLSTTAAGALLTLPVLCFGALAPAAGLLARRMGYERTLAIAVAALVAGLVVRVTGGPPLLFLGTALAGGGIAIGNVLLPVFVKRSFPEHAGLMSGLYTTALVACAAISAGVTEPLSHALGEGWRGGLGFWAIPAAIALLVWLPQMRGSTNAPAPLVPTRRLLRDPLALQLTLYMALQSGGFYAILSWLPSILSSHGIDHTTAGLLLGLNAAIGLPAALLVPTIATRARDQRAIAAIFTVVTALGYLGLLTATDVAPALWAVIIGIGQGACFPLGLTLIVLRSRDVAQTASLSTLVQSGGYLIAAAVPLAAGALHDLTGSWTWPLVLLIVLTLPQLWSGLLAGRNRVVGE